MVTYCSWMCKLITACENSAVPIFVINWDGRKSQKLESQKPQYVFNSQAHLFTTYKISVLKVNSNHKKQKRNNFFGNMKHIA